MSAPSPSSSSSSSSDSIESRAAKKRRTCPRLTFTSINDDCLRDILLFLPIASAVSLASTSHTCRALLDEQTAAALVASSVPVFSTLLSRSLCNPPPSPKTFYSEWTRAMNTSFGSPTRNPAGGGLALSDVSLSVRFCYTWHELPASGGEGKRVELSFPPSVQEEEWAARDTYLEYYEHISVMACDLRNGRCVKFYECRSGECAGSGDLSDLVMNYAENKHRMFLPSKFMSAMLVCEHSNEFDDIVPVKLCLDEVNWWRDAGWELERGVLAIIEGEVSGQACWVQEEDKEEDEEWG